MVFSRSFRAEVVIDADAERVWDVVTNFAAYPEWNPYMKQVQLHGDLATGTKFTATLAPVGKATMDINPTVVAATRPTEFHYHHSMGFATLLHGEHILRIEPQPGGTCVRVVKLDEFSGLLVPLFINPSAIAAHSEGVELMLAALKKRVQGG